MSKFKVGDRVKFTSKHNMWPDHIDNNGNMGVILEPLPELALLYPNEYRVEFSGYVQYKTSSVIQEDELEYAKVKDTKIARLVHKCRIEKIEDGYIWLGSK